MSFEAVEWLPIDFSIDRSVPNLSLSFARRIGPSLLGDARQNVLG